MEDEIFENPASSVRCPGVQGQAEYFGAESLIEILWNHKVLACLVVEFLSGNLPLSIVVATAVVQKAQVQRKRLASQ
jgi:hypothetical protein